MFDYETLKIAWWLIIGVTLVGFAITDGFDMGIGALIPFASDDDDERRVMINTIAPHWDGNQVWFVLAVGAIFAAWPMVYGIAFSGFYAAMMLTLFALFFRPIGFDYRSKIEDTRWRYWWDWAIFVGSAVPAFMFGLIFGNLFVGLDYSLDDTLRVSFNGSFFSMFNPFGILSGLMSLSMLIMHGSIYLQMRTKDPFRISLSKYTLRSAYALVVMLIVAGFWLAYGMIGLNVESNILSNEIITPLMKTVSTHQGAWLDNFSSQPYFIWAPVSAIVCVLLVIWASNNFFYSLGFAFSSLSIISIIATAALALFPFILPSSSHPSQSLTLWDAVSSEYTLGIMLLVAAFFVPLILFYTLWAYYKMWRKMSAKDIQADSHSLY